VEPNPERKHIFPQANTAARAFRSRDSAYQRESRYRQVLFQKPADRKIERGFCFFLHLSELIAREWINLTGRLIKSKWSLQRILVTSNRFGMILHSSKGKCSGSNTAIAEVVQKTKSAITAPNAPSRSGTRHAYRHCALR
jgi:hypothetical protein